MHSDTEAAIVDAVEALRREAQQPAWNDPAGYDAIVSASDSLWEFRRFSGPDTPVESINEHLQDAAAVLATAARFSPGQSMLLARAVFEVAKESLSGAELDRLNDTSFHRSPSAERARDFPALDALLSIMGDPAPLFPHGLVPAEPEWPAEVLAVRSGKSRARKAFATLHEQGWDMASEHYSFYGLSLRAARPWLAASAAFARTAAGATAETDVAEAWRRFIMDVEDPHTLLVKFAPPSKWVRAAGPYSEMAEAVAVAERLLDVEDLDAATRLLDQIDSRPDLASPHDQVQVQRLRGEGARKRAAAAAVRARAAARAAARGPDFGTDTLRPLNKGPAPRAPARPASAQAIMDAAQQKDPDAAEFATQLGARGSRLALASSERLTPGHLWLLFEFDEHVLNADVAAHPAADTDLIASILMQSRHWGRKALTSHSELKALVRERPDLAPLVLSHAISPELICCALSEHRAVLRPAEIARLVTRTLDLTGKQALTVLAGIRNAFGDALPAELDGVIAEAEDDAAGEPVDRLSLRASMEVLAERLDSLGGPADDPGRAGAMTGETTAARPGPGVYGQDDASAAHAAQVAGFLAGVVASQSRSEVERLLNHAPDPVPWDQMAGMVAAGQVGRETVRALAAREDATGQFLRACATRLDRATQAITSAMEIASTNDAWRWLAPLLEDPLPLDAASSRARVELAAFVLLQEPRDLSSRLPKPEFATVVDHVAPRFLNNSVGDHDFAEKVRVVDSWVRDGRIDRVELATQMRLPAAIALCWTAVSHRPGTEVTFQSLPEPLRRWLDAALEREVPDGDARAMTRAAVSYWPSSLKGLVRLAAAFCSELEDLADPEYDADDDEELFDEDADAEAGVAPEPATQGPFLALRYDGSFQVVRLDPSEDVARAVLSAPRSGSSVLEGIVAILVPAKESGDRGVGDAVGQAGSSETPIVLTQEQVADVLDGFSIKPPAPGGGVLWFAEQTGDVLGQVADWVIRRFEDKADELEKFRRD